MKLARKTTILLALLLALVSLVAAVAPALAANDTSSADPSAKPLPDGLAIVAPVAARPDQPVTMTVFRRSDQTPMPDAGVWAFTKDQTARLDAAIGRLREAGTALNADTDWQGIVSGIGSFLGRTDDLGKLTASFHDGGRRLLVAVKPGYLPGRAVIAIVVKIDALALRAPQQADVNAEVTLGVFDRGTSAPVAGAGVWALTKDQAEALKNDLAGQAPGAETDWDSLLAVRGTFLGRTGDTGELTASFAESGGYLLIAAKAGYLPARAPVFIGRRPEPLALQVQGRARIDETVPVHVMDRNSGDPVEGAGVWALTKGDAEAFRQDMAGLKNANTDLTQADLSATLGARGSYLGATDANGNLETGFAKPGIWVLVTWKPGCLPGFGAIQVVGPDASKVRPENRPGNAGSVTPPATANVTGPAR